MHATAWAFFGALACMSAAATALARGSCQVSCLCLSGQQLLRCHLSGVVGELGLCSVDFVARAVDGEFMSRRRLLGAAVP